jgi:formylglycine-generating enzyme required for sulfatase activity/pimeloyl-ACP methyl ester carboxylesterase
MNVDFRTILRIWMFPLAFLYGSAMASIEDFVYIPPGAFNMGTPIGELGHQSHETLHQVTLTRGFWLSKYEVTDSLWAQVMGGSSTSQQPKVNMNWYQAIEFCNAMSARDGLTPAYTWTGTQWNWNQAANGFRLPTEAEWEYACRAGSTTAYTNGPNTSLICGDPVLSLVGWYCGGGPNSVGLKQANAWGLYDMHGNANEWCWDWFEVTPSAAVIDPVGPTSGTYKVLRGSSYSSYAQDLRSGARHTNYADVGNDHQGFRLARSANSSFMITASAVGMGANAPVPGAKLSVLKNGVAIAEGTTNAQGVCNVIVYLNGSDVPNGPAPIWYLRASTSPTRTSEVPISTPVAGGQYTYSISISDRIPASGTVIDAFNQQGIAGAAVVVMSSANQVVSASFTNAEGVFRCNIPAAGQYAFVATKNGAIGTRANQVLYAGNSSGLVNVPLSDTTVDLGTVALDSKVVMLVHGINSNSDIWTSSGYADALRAAGWSVVDDIDLPGELLGNHGFASIPDQASALKLRLDGLGVRSVHVVAHSQGGLVSRYMNESLADEPGNVNKLIALATPQHGSPLAGSITHIRGLVGDLLFFAKPYLKTLKKDKLLEAIYKEAPAGDDLRPNSDFLRNLNQRASHWWTADWGGDCFWNDPSSEKGLRSRTAYVTIRGNAWGSDFYVLGMHLAGVYRCSESDGIVPTESAFLHSTATNVHNYAAPEDVHHKRLPEPPAVPGIVYSTGTRDVVIALLAEEPSNWPAESAQSTYADAPGGNAWHMTGVGEALVEPDSIATLPLTVDACDSLMVEWSWYTGQVDLRLFSPVGALIDSAYAATHADVTHYVDLAAHRAGFVIGQPEAGAWTIACDGTRAGETQNVFITYAAAGAATIEASIADHAIGAVSERIVTARLRLADGQGLDGARVAATWTAPDGTTGTLAMVDDGIWPDTAMDDGQYAALLTLPRNYGWTSVQVEATGTEPFDFTRGTPLGFMERPSGDLFIAEGSVVAESQNFQTLCPLVIDVPVVNSGDEAADVEVMIFDAAGILLACNSGTVPAAGVAHISSSWLPLTPGVFEMTARVVSSGAFNDLDLANNVATVSFEIGVSVSGVDDGMDGGTPGDPVIAALGSRGVSIVAAFPNPFNPELTLEFAQAAAGWVDVDVFDVRGARVRQLHRDWHAAETFRVTWDGRDDRGVPLAAGAYFVRMRAAAGGDVRKVMLMP